MALRTEIERGVLVDDVAVRRRVHPHGAREDHAAGVGAPRGLEHARRAQHSGRDAFCRLRDHVVDVGHRCEVEHRPAAFERIGESVLLEKVDLGPIGN